VEDAAKTLLQRVDAMENELGALIDSLRTGANRLTGDLTQLRDNMDELRTVVVGGGDSAALAEAPGAEAAFEAVPEAPPEPAYEGPAVEAPEAAAFDEAAVEVPEAEVVEPEPAEFEPAPDEPEPAAVAAAPQAGEPPSAEPQSAPDDVEGARLIALNMALNGTPRDETDRYLAENFQLADRETLLDEVYARVG
jgi:hypothetical protein